MNRKSAPGDASEHAPRPLPSRAVIRLAALAILFAGCGGEKTGPIARSDKQVQGETSSPVSEPTAQSETLHPADVANDPSQDRAGEEENAGNQDLSEANALDESSDDDTTTSSPPGGDDNVGSGDGASDTMGEDDAGSSKNGEGQGGSVAADAMAPEAVMTPAPTVRLLLPTTRGVLLADVDVRLGQRPLADAFDDRIATVIADASGEEPVEEKTDEDESGEEESDENESGEVEAAKKESVDNESDVAMPSVLTWEGLFEHVNGDGEQFGSRQPLNKNQYRAAIRRYDTNRNQRPEPEEVAKFLFRASGFAGPFRLSGTDHYRGINRSQSKLFQAIDRSGDRLLDAEEVANAPQALMRFDVNADRGVDINEVVTVPMQNDPAWNRRRMNRRGEVAMDLSGYIDWTMVTYALDGRQDETIFGSATNVLRASNENGDDTLTKAEVASLSDGEPDLKLQVTFDRIFGDPSVVEILSIRPEWEGLCEVRKSGRVASLSGPGLQLSFHVVDAPVARRDRIPQEAFTMLDANNDGLLDEDEIPAVAADEFSIDDLDKDGDNKLSLQEINGRQIEKPPIWRVQVRGRAAEFPDAVFGLLDHNHDHFLAEREILAASERLQEHAVPPLRPDDLPDVFVVQFVRGDPAQDNQTFRFVSSPQAAVDSLPPWARAMDANADGDIAPLEFIGTPAQFNKLDADGDGFIGAADLDSENEPKAEPESPKEESVRERDSEITPDSGQGVETSAEAETAVE